MALMRSSLRWTLARLHRDHRRRQSRSLPDTVRLPLQTVAAVLCAYFAMRWLDHPDLSWAAFSALFVVRASMEGTATEAWTRVAGALVGVLIGVALVSWQPLDGDARWAIVAAGVGIMGVVAARWPILNYGLVTVAIITVEPDANLLGDAWGKSTAIMVGSLSGVLAALAVLPLSAGRQARQALARSLHALADSVDICAKTLLDCHAPQRQTRHRSVHPDAEAAREILLHTRLPRWSAHTDSHAVTKLLECVDGLWRTLPLLDRATERPLSEQACTRHAESFGALASAVRRDLRHMASLLNQRGSEPRPLACVPAREQLSWALFDEAAVSRALRPAPEDADEETAAGTEDGIEAAAEARPEAAVRTAGQARSDAAAYASSAAAADVLPAGVVEARPGASAEARSEAAAQAPAGIEAKAAAEGEKAARAGSAAVPDRATGQPSRCDAGAEADGKPRQDSATLLAYWAWDVLVQEVQTLHSQLRSQSRSR